MAQYTGESLSQTEANRREKERQAAGSPQGGYMFQFHLKGRIYWYIYMMHYYHE